MKLFLTLTLSFTFFYFCGMGQVKVDSGFINLPNSFQSIKQNEINRMKVYHSDIKDSFNKEYLQLVYSFDKLGRIQTIENYYKNNLAYLIKNVYQDSTEILLKRYLVPTSILNIEESDCRDRRGRIIMSADNYSDSKRYTYTLNEFGLYATLVDFTKSYYFSKTKRSSEVKNEPQYKLRFEYIKFYSASEK